MKSFWEIVIKAAFLFRLENWKNKTFANYFTWGMARRIKNGWSIVRAVYRKDPLIAFCRWSIETVWRLRKKASGWADRYICWPGFFDRSYDSTFSSEAYLFDHQSEILRHSPRKRLWQYHKLFPWKIQDNNQDYSSTISFSSLCILQLFKVYIN